MQRKYYRDWIQKGTETTRDNRATDRRRPAGTAITAGNTAVPPSTAFHCRNVKIDNAHQSTRVG